MWLIPNILFFPVAQQAAGSYSWMAWIYREELLAFNSLKEHHSIQSREFTFQCWWSDRSKRYPYHLTHCTPGKVSFCLKNHYIFMLDSTSITTKNAIWCKPGDYIQDMSILDQILPSGTKPLSDPTLTLIFWPHGIARSQWVKQSSQYPQRPKEWYSKITNYKCWRCLRASSNSPKIRNYNSLSKNISWTKNCHTANHQHKIQSMYALFIIL